MAARKNKLKSNEDLVMDLMRFSPVGPMSQIFVVDAIAKHAKLIANTPIAQLREQFGERSMVSADVWHAAAVDIDKRVDAFYARHDEPR